eukprot:jgi/Mesvir1/10654/Mv13746-RA.2
MVLEEQEFLMLELVENVARMFGVGCASKNVELVLDVCNRIPPLVCGDAMRISQIFINLVSNAFKFTSEGHILIRVRAEDFFVPSKTALQQAAAKPRDNNRRASHKPSYADPGAGSGSPLGQLLRVLRDRSTRNSATEQDDGRVPSYGALREMVGHLDGESMVRFCCDVEDTGMGVAPDMRSRIFEMFVQADNTTTRKFGGTGLGLSIVRCLLELMGGSINLIDKPDGQPGTLMRFSFFCKRCSDSPISSGREDYMSMSSTVLAELNELSIHNSQSGRTPFGNLMATSALTPKAPLSPKSQLAPYDPLASPRSLGFSLKGADALARVPAALTSNAVATRGMPPFRQADKIGQWLDGAVPGATPSSSQSPRGAATLAWERLEVDGLGLTGGKSTDSTTQRPADQDSPVFPPLHLPRPAKDENLNSSTPVAEDGPTLLDDLPRPSPIRTSSDHEPPTGLVKKLNLERGERDFPVTDAIAFIASPPPRLSSNGLDMVTVHPERGERDFPVTDAMAFIVSPPRSLSKNRLDMLTVHPLEFTKLHAVSNSPLSEVMQKLARSSSSDDMTGSDRQRRRTVMLPMVRKVSGTKGNGMRGRDDRNMSVNSDALPGWEPRQSEGEVVESLRRTRSQVGNWRDIVLRSISGVSGTTRRLSKSSLKDTPGSMGTMPSTPFRPAKPAVPLPATKFRGQGLTVVLAMPNALARQVLVAGLAKWQHGVKVIQAAGAAELQAVLQPRIATWRLAADLHGGADLESVMDPMLLIVEDAILLPAPQARSLQSRDPVDSETPLLAAEAAAAAATAAGLASAGRGTAKDALLRISTLATSPAALSKGRRSVSRSVSMAAKASDVDAAQAAADAVHAVTVTECKAILGKLPPWVDVVWLIGYKSGGTSCRMLEEVRPGTPLESKPLHALLMNQIVSRTQNRIAALREGGLDALSRSNQGGSTSGTGGVGSGTGNNSGREITSSGGHEGGTDSENLTQTHSSLPAAPNELDYGSGSSSRGWAGQNTIGGYPTINSLRSVSSNMKVWEPDLQGRLSSISRPDYLPHGGGLVSGMPSAGVGNERRRSKTHSETSTSMAGDWEYPRSPSSISGGEWHLDYRNMERDPSVNTSSQSGPPGPGPHHGAPYARAPGGASWSRVSSASGTPLSMRVGGGGGVSLGGGGGAALFRASSAREEDLRAAVGLNDPGGKSGSKLMRREGSLSSPRLGPPRDELDGAMPFAHSPQRDIPSVTDWDWLDADKSGGRGDGSSNWPSSSSVARGGRVRARRGSSSDLQVTASKLHTNGDDGGGGEHNDRSLVRTFSRSFSSRHGGDGGHGGCGGGGGGYRPAASPSSCGSSPSMGNRGRTRKPRLSSELGKLERDPTYGSATGGGTSHRVPLTSLEGLRLIVAEDTPLTQRLLRVMLEKAGAIVTTADNGQEALDAIEANQAMPFDALVTDCQSWTATSWRSTSGRPRRSTAAACPSWR